MKTTKKIIHTTGNWFTATLSRLAGKADKCLKEKTKKYQLITCTTWTSHSDIPEVILEGTRSEINAYAKTARFAWERVKSKPLGGHYVRSIDGYRKKFYDIIEVK